VDAAVRWDRYDLVALLFAVFVVIWFSTFKLKTFYDLGYTSDLFAQVQLARSWLDGRGLLEDNCFGNMLVLHTYFLLLPLGLIAKPFGAPGLLVVLAAAAGATYFWAVRVLRLLGVHGPLALAAAGALLASPLAVWFYQVSFYGFYVETLVPALCLILFYFLLRRRMIASIITALAVISVKEDAPIAAAIISIVALVETWISSAVEDPRQRLNWPALITFFLSVLAIPLLLAISWSQPPTMYAVHSVDQLGIVRPGTIRGPGALFVFIASNVTGWLGSSAVRQWLAIMIVGSFGMIFLRPYYLLFGVVTTVVAWLKNINDLLWTPRFFLTESFLWCVTLVVFASLVRVLTSGGRWTRRITLGVAIIIAMMSASVQLAFLSKVRGAYLLHSESSYSPLERQQADAVFARYRGEAKPDEPVVASPMLFRYAHDRNLFWLDRMIGRPAPMWILSDGTDNYGFDDVRVKDSVVVDRSGRCMLRINDYTLVDRRGRFMLLRKK